MRSCLCARTRRPRSSDVAATRLMVGSSAVARPTRGEARRGGGGRVDDEDDDDGAPSSSAADTLAPKTHLRARHLHVAGLLQRLARPLRHGCCGGAAEAREREEQRGKGGGEGEEGVARPALCFARARGCGFRAVRKGVPHGVAVVRVCADLRLRGQMSLRCACLGAGARGLVARLWGTGAGRRAARYRLALPAALAKRTERGRVFKSKTTALQHE